MKYIYIFIAILLISGIIFIYNNKKEEKNKEVYEALRSGLEKDLNNSVNEMNKEIKNLKCYTAKNGNYVCE